MLKMIPISLLLFLLLSCAQNKSIVMTPDKPFEYYENNVKFSISQSQPLYIEFQTPHVTQDEGRGHPISPSHYIPFYVDIDTNQKLENIYLKSFGIIIDDINIKIEKDIMYQIEMREVNNINYQFSGSFNTYIGELMRIGIDEIIENISEDITKMELFDKFSNKFKIEFHTIIEYNIDGIIYESNLLWNYNARKRIMFAILDTLASV